MNIQRALISVSNKTNLHELAPFLQEKGVEILSTGGTRKYLTQHRVKSTEVSKYTGFPEMMEGRLKTLHPLIHGGILGRRGQDEEVMSEHNINPIDLVIVNLYDFEGAISKSDCGLDCAVENIDIGGPTMLRSAAKNFNDVVVLVDPTDYDEFMVNYDNITLQRRLKYAQKVFAHTSKYDNMISQYLFYNIFKVK